MSSGAATWSLPLCPDPLVVEPDWETLVAEWGWLRAMAACGQDPAHHAEGDVLAHTRMVCDALVADDEWHAGDVAMRMVTFAAAMLHDIAKPSTSRLQAGHIESPGHAAAGATRVSRLLYADWPADRPSVTFDQRLQIVGLVRHHGLPLWFWDKPDPVRAVVEASWSVRCDHLGLVAAADARGRIASDVDALLDRLALFRETCVEHGCWDRPRSFPSDHSRFEYFRRPGRFLDHAAYDDTRCEVVMLSGLPGAGKDTWLRAHLQGQPVVSLDDLRREMRVAPGGDQGQVVALGKQAARGHLRAGRAFAWNATNLTRAMRRGLIDLFAAYRVRIRIVYLEAPWAEIRRRNHVRDLPVPEAVLRRMAARLEVPEPAEAHEVTYVVA